ncbi:MAG: hypothetical protein QOG94_2986, partial [Solirubrobacteraceae bacterium]|nr:hypothetical protein [Solirubrobacteraceae bacterium]
MRQRDPLSVDDARELDALERALAGDPVDADLRELEQLVHDVRATAPQMTPGFAARLEHDLAQGFPQSREASPARRAPRRWLLLPAVGSLAAVAVALVVVLGQHGPSDQISELANRPQQTVEDRSPSAGASETGSPTAKRSAPAAAAPPSGAATAPPSPASVARDRKAAASPQASARILPGAPGGSRKVQRTADLVLGVPTSKVASTSDGVIRTVDRFDGIVASSTSASDDDT